MSEVSFVMNGKATSKITGFRDHKVTNVHYLSLVLQRLFGVHNPFLKCGKTVVIKTVHGVICLPSRSHFKDNNGDVEVARIRSLNSAFADRLKVCVGPYLFSVLIKAHQIL